MSIDRLSSTASLIAALRSDVLRRMEGTQASAKPQRTQAPPQRQVEGPSIEQLQRQLVEMAKQVDIDDPAAVRIARGVFIRNILVWEFGAEFREHPDWRPLMDYVEGTLDVDPAHQARFVKLLIALRGGKAR